MATNTANVMRGVTGAVYVLPDGAAAPTSAVSAITGSDLGWISEDGVTQTDTGAAEREVIRGWQNNGVVQVIRSTSDDNPTFTFTLIESKIEVVEWALGVTVTRGEVDGSWVVNANNLPEPHPMVIDVIHGPRVLRKYIPRAIRTELGDRVYAYGELIGFEVTVECELDDGEGGIGGHLIEYDTAYATP